LYGVVVKQEKDSSSIPVLQFYDEDSLPTAVTEEGIGKAAAAAANRAARETWNWCSRFVVRYDLCPWAAASVRTAHAVRVHVVVVADGERRQEELMEAATRQVSRDFARELETAGADPNAAIAFVVLLKKDPPWDFEEFYDWFVGLEELQWSEEEEEDLADVITLAPFHPDWSFAAAAADDDGGPDALAFEKKSPYPTVSIVSTAAIDKAGPEATERIAENNEKTLLEKSVSEWRQLYDRAIHFKEGGPTE
jgi:hypothetical protein